jgi:hypothetical protein
MGSLTRKLKKIADHSDRNDGKDARRRVQVERALFGLTFAPTGKLTAERQELVAQFRSVMDAWGESDPARLLEFMRSYMRRVHNPATDGPSEIMGLLRAIDAQQEAESETWQLIKESMNDHPTNE